MSPSAGWFKNTEGAYSKGLNLLCPVAQSYSEIFHNCWTNVFFIPQRTDSVVWYFRKYYYTLLIKCSSSSSFGQLKITQNKTLSKSRFELQTNRGINCCTFLLSQNEQMMFLYFLTLYHNHDRESCKCQYQTQKLYILYTVVYSIGKKVKLKTKVKMQKCLVFSFPKCYQKCTKFFIKFRFKNSSCEILTYHLFCISLVHFPDSNIVPKDVRWLMWLILIAKHEDINFIIKQVTMLSHIFQ